MAEQRKKNAEKLAEEILERTGYDFVEIEELGIRIERPKKGAG